MLLGDGSPTRHLQLLTGQPVAVDLIAMEPEAELPTNAPPEVAELPVSYTHLTLPTTSMV